jgi:hypothetical protein
LDKQIVELEGLLEELRLRRKRVWAARWKAGYDAWVQTDEYKKLSAQLQQTRKDAIRAAQIRGSQAEAAHWNEHQMASEWDNQCWAASRSSGSGQRWTAYEWRSSDWNTWWNSGKETAWQADTNGSAWPTLLDRFGHRSHGPGQFVC